MKIWGILLLLPVVWANVNLEIITRTTIRELCPRLAEFTPVPGSINVEKNSLGCYFTELTISNTCPENYLSLKIKLNQTDLLGFQIGTEKSYSNIQKDLRDYLTWEAFQSGLARTFRDQTRNLLLAARSCPIGLVGSSILYCYSPGSRDFQIRLTDLGQVEENKSERGLENLVTAWTNLAEESNFPTRFWVVPPLPGHPTDYPNLYKRLQSENIQCIMSEASCSSMIFADYLADKFFIRWHHDSRLGGLHDCQSGDYPTFQERYPISRDEIDSKVRLPKDCLRPIIVGSEMTIRSLLYIGNKLAPGTLMVSQDNKEPILDRVSLNPKYGVAKLSHLSTESGFCPKIEPTSFEYFWQRLG